MATGNIWISKRATGRTGNVLLTTFCLDVYSVLAFYIGNPDGVGCNANKHVAPHKKGVEINNFGSLVISRKDSKYVFVYSRVPSVFLAQFNLLTRPFISHLNFPRRDLSADG